MARVWFAKGVQGEIVRKIQLRLKESGFDPKGIDGDFGPNTVRALRRFQEQNNHTESTSFHKLPANSINHIY